ncbi:hypothetical protein SDC9_82031 [bioreactor metagenome]|uniref:Uncharacterized protein n=1 Tax=bioreactor metagenome TaxID=1076179 RepID=A0A644Z4E4_9ZZZZ
MGLSGNDYTIVGCINFAVARQLTVSASRCSKVNNHRTGFHNGNMFLQNQLRSRFTGNLCRCNNNINLQSLLPEQFHFGINKGLTHLLAVAGRGGAVLVNGDRQELCPHRLDLFGHFLSCIKSPDNGAHRIGRSQCGKSCHAGTNNKYLCRFHFPGGSDLSVEKTAEITGSFNHSTVSGNIGHRRQNVHFLSPRNTRNGIHGNGVDFIFCQQFQQCLILCGPQITHGYRSGLH